MFRTDEFFRGPQWTTVERREELQPLIALAVRGWNELEVLSVSSGLRSSALVTVSIEDLVRATRAVSMQNLELTVLGKVMIAETYTSASGTSGQPGMRVAVHRPGLRTSWLEAWEGAGDQDKIGALLGFPPCCIEHFKRTWVERRLQDPTHSVLGNGIDGPAEVNILLRWIGVRLVPHLPCSFSCRATSDLGRAFAQLGSDNGMTAEIDAALYLLGLEMTYSALNGIGRVETEGFRFEFPTDQTLGLVQAHRSRIARVELRAFTGEPLETPQNTGIVGDNGFRSRSAMTDAHAVVLSTVETLGLKHATVVDLGCGDGTLLNKLVMAGVADRGIGYEQDAEKAKRGSSRYPDLTLRAMLIQNIEALMCDLVLISVARIQESTVEQRRRLEVLFRGARNIVIYSYDNEDIIGEVQRTGINLTPALDTLRTAEHFSAAQFLEVSSCEA